jgi:hypothetical protein
MIAILLLLSSPQQDFFPKDPTDDLLREYRAAVSTYYALIQGPDPQARRKAFERVQNIHDRLLNQARATLVSGNWKGGYINTIRGKVDLKGVSPEDFHRAFCNLFSYGIRNTHYPLDGGGTTTGPLGIINGMRQVVGEVCESKQWGPARVTKLMSDLETQGRAELKRPVDNLKHLEVTLKHVRHFTESIASGELLKRVTRNGKMQTDMVLARSEDFFLILLIEDRLASGRKLTVVPIHSDFKIFPFRAINQKNINITFVAEEDLFGDVTDLDHKLYWTGWFLTDIGGLVIQYDEAAKDYRLVPLSRVAGLLRAK